MPIRRIIGRESAPEKELKQAEKMANSLKRLITRIKRDNKRLQNPKEKNRIRVWKRAEANRKKVSKLLSQIQEKMFRSMGR